MKRSLILLILTSSFFLSSARKIKYMLQPQGYIYVPTGELITEDDKYKMHAYWMKDTEVTNEEYRIYLESTGLKGEELMKRLPDSSVMSGQLWISQYIDYFNHDVFRNFPVVGLTRWQMEEYASWKTDQMNKKYPGLRYKFRLPNKAEWQYAASAGEGYQQIYPWNSQYVANTKGCYLMCFLNMGQRNNLYGDSAKHTSVYRNDIGQELMADEYERLMEGTKGLRKIKKLGLVLPMIGLPVFAYAYFPNNYGLYNMAGNVAEMLVSGEVVGGSFRTSEAYCHIFDAKPYPFDATVPQADVGFRLVCDYVRPTFSDQRDH